MKEVILEGFLAEKYGRTWNINASMPSEIFQCIEANYPELRKDIIDLAESGGGLTVQLGSDYADVEDLLVPITADSIIITPIAAGSSGKGTGKIIAGIALLVFSYFMPGMFGFGPLGTGGFDIMAKTIYGTAQLTTAAIGVNLSLKGLAELMAPDPAKDEAEIYSFNGPENIRAQGNPVPILCGEMIIGGITMSSGTVGGIHRNLGTYTQSYRNLLNGVINPASPGYELDTYNPPRFGNAAITANANIVTQILEDEQENRFAY
jgi:predicted phage tail protein